DEHNKCRDRANKQGVKVDAQCLYQSLLNRMTDRRRRSNIWHRTHSSLIGEHTALHTVHDGGTDRTTADCLEVKSTRKQLAHHPGQLLGVSQHDNETK